MIKKQGSLDFLSNTPHTLIKGSLYFLSLDLLRIISHSPYLLIGGKREVKASPNLSRTTEYKAS